MPRSIARRSSALFGLPQAAEYAKKLSELNLPDSDIKPEKAGVSVKGTVGYCGELVSFYAL